jgi:type II secretory pathway component PulK
LNQKWAGGPGSAMTSNLLAVVELPAGTKIVDMERRANINIIAQGAPQQRQLLDQAMRLIGVDPADSGPVMSSIVDWIDADNAENPNGTETDYYESLPRPYKCKNAPIDDMSELLLVRGMTPEILWGGVARERSPSAMKSRLRQNDQPLVYPVGLADLFSALSAGPININTAPREVLAMVLNGDEAAADRIIACRAGPDGADGTEDDVPFRNPQEGLACAQIPNSVIPSLAGYFSTRSRLFQVEVHAEFNGTHRYFYAVIDRDAPPDKKVLTFFWKHQPIPTSLNRNADAR